jgi:LPS O-antigen subunit length determinant protein (WzzB/FepE family)
MEFISQGNLLTILFDEDWDKRAGKWTVGDEDVPTLADGVELFDEDIRSVSVDSNTGLVSLSIEWTDPALAAAWANELVVQLNHMLRERDMREASSSLEYLQQELAKSGVIEIRGALFELIEQQQKRRMLASVHEQYAFRVLDPAVAPEVDDPVRPRLAVVMSMAALLGVLFGAFAALLVELSADGTKWRSGAT